MAQKSPKPDHIEKSKLLKELRLGAGMKQQQLADRLGVTRDIVSHIENCHLQQMESLRSDFEQKWWQVCQTTTTPVARESWRDYIRKKIGI